MAGILKECGIVLSPLQLGRLWAYHELLREHNADLNLTRIHNFNNMVLKLYVDSILPGKLMELPSPLLDLGTGPGMPGIPLKIAYPRLDILLAESRQKRVSFLRSVVERLALPGLSVVAEGIGPRFEYPVAGVITRAVESIGDTLDRVRGCLSKGGLAIFMKGPHCDEEVREAARKFHDSYKLVEDKAYRIPKTPHARRLVTFERMDEPLRARKAFAVKRNAFKRIESEQNDTFKELKKLLTGRGIKKSSKALVCGTKIITEIVRDFPGMCDAWITGEKSAPPPAPETMRWYELPDPLFKILDIFGTGTPLLVVRTPEILQWTPAQGLREGCTLFIPFQDPENVGTAIRSAAAFGVTQVILLEESANPFHPKAIRASGGSVFRVSLLKGPSLSEISEDLPILALSSEGRSISDFIFPASFGLLPGIEGPGLPESWRNRALAIPMSSDVESLNASAATAIALYLWAQARGR